MEMRKIGSLEVSLIGLGCNDFGRKLDQAATTEVVRAALDWGINFFDTADMYGETLSEQYLGKALKGRRDKAVVATKFGWKLDEDRHGAHPSYVRRAVEANLKRLDIDCIDLYQLHQPDPSVPIADTLGALNELVHAGKVREIGCSNFSAAQIREAQNAVSQGAARFVSVQNQYSMVHREPELEVIPECVLLGVAFIPFFPLASGLLTGKHRRGQFAAGSRLTQANWANRFATEQNLRLVDTLIQFAEGRGHTMLELALSWLATRPAVASIIAGAKTPEQVRLNAEAPVWKLTEPELSELAVILKPARPA